MAYLSRVSKAGDENHRRLPRHTNIGGKKMLSHSFTQTHEEQVKIYPLLTRYRY